MIKHSLFVLFAVLIVILQLTLIVLKCCDLITANWYAVWIPFYTFAVVFFLIIIISFFIKHVKENKLMEKIKYDDFLKMIVNREYNDIDIERNNWENGKGAGFKIVLKRGEWVTKNNSQKYEYKTYYYDFDIDDIINLILDLRVVQDNQTKNRILKVIEKNNDALLKELGND